MSNSNLLDHSLPRAHEVTSSASPILVSELAEDTADLSFPVDAALPGCTFDKEKALKAILEDARKLNWRQRQRYVVPILSFFALIIMYLVRYPLTHAMLEIKKTNRYGQPDEGSIKGAFFIGYIPSQVLGGHLSRMYGGKYVNLTGLLLSCLACSMIPLLSVNFSLFFLSRVVIGIGQGIMYPAIVDLLRSWILPIERSFLVNFAYSGGQAGTIIEFALYPYLMEVYGWKFGFYLFPAIGVIWAVFWLVFVYNNPEDHPFLSQEERSVLKAYHDYNHGQKKDDRSKKIPYFNILTSCPVYALILTTFSFNWTFYLFMDSIVKYCKPILGPNLPLSNYLITSLPYMIFWMVLLLSGFVSDWLVRSSMRLSVVKRMHVLLGFIPAAIMLFLIPEYNDPLRAYISLIFVVALSGVSQCGYITNALDLSPDFSAVITGFVNMFASSTGLIVPSITGQILHYGKCTDQYPEPESCVFAWRILFYIAGSVYIFGAIVWTFFSRFNALNLDKERSICACSFFNRFKLFPKSVDKSAPLYTDNAEAIKKSSTSNLV
jgi:ACS family sodium-dependent inorganic phosphate cotransporter